MSYDTLPDLSPRFVYGPGDVRMTCECCGFPTLPLAPDAEWSGVDWENSVLACPVCSWESGPALDDGSPDPAGPSAEDRNEGHTLAEAEANFRRHGWMYDPADPPAWMLGSPTVEETRLRHALREAYEALVAPAEGRGDGWARVLDLELQLRAAEEARRAALEEALDAEDAGDAESDLDA